VPDEIAAAAGGPTVLTFAGHGHGAGGPAQMPRPVRYMRHEADVVLPAHSPHSGSNALCPWATAMAPR